MTQAKRYFWLKLKNDFFDNKEIKKLRKVAGGDTFTIIYLKMQLLSIKRDGLILFDGTEENLAEQLSIELGEEEDNVKMTLIFLEKNRLIEQIENDEFLLTKVPEIIGSEGTSAERMRKYRKEIGQNASHCDTRVTLGDSKVQKSYTEIEIEKEIEKEKENNTCAKDDNHLAMVKYDDDHQYFQIAKHLREKILLINDKAKVPKLDAQSMAKWSDDVRKIVEIDKRTLDEFKELTEFAFRSDFWSTVIQSPAGFRKNWDKMFAQMKRPVSSKGNVISFDRQMEVCREFLEEG